MAYFSSILVLKHEQKVGFSYPNVLTITLEDMERTSTKPVEDVWYNGGISHGISYHLYGKANPTILM